MTTSEHISMLRNRIRQYRDDAYFTDEYLYNLLVDSRSILIHNKAAKGRPISYQNWQKFCMPLREDNYFDCDCVPDDKCKVMKSISELPEMLYSKSSPLLKVTTVSGIEIPYFSHAQIRDIEHTKILKNRIIRTNWNGYITLFNHDGLSVIVVEGVVKDPSKLADISVCALDGTPVVDPCYDPTTDAFPIDSELARAMRDLAMQELGYPTQQNEKPAKDE